MGDRIIEDAEGNLVVQQSLAATLESIKQGQTAGFSELRTALAAKADRADMARIDGDLVDVKMRLGAMENRLQSEETDKAARFTRKEKLWGGVCAVVLICATFFGPIIANVVR